MFDNMVRLRESLNRDLKMKHKHKQTIAATTSTSTSTSLFSSSSSSLSSFFLYFLVSKLSYMPLLVKATSLALKQFPGFVYAYQYMFIYVCM